MLNEVRNSTRNLPWFTPSDVNPTTDNIVLPVFQCAIPYWYELVSNFLKFSWHYDYCRNAKACDTCKCKHKQECASIRRNALQANAVSKNLSCPRSRTSPEHYGEGRLEKCEGMLYEVELSGVEVVSGF
jgi:hypothetical protein